MSRQVSAQVYDVVVVGAGVVGLSTAWQLSLMGKQVLLLEQFPFPHSRGSSHGHSRIIRKAYLQSHYAAMMPRAYDLWHQLERENNTKLLYETGLVYMSNGPYLDKLESSFIVNNIPYERWSPRELTEHYPNFKALKKEAIFDSTAGILRADLCLTVLKESAVRSGVVFRDSSKVTSLVAVNENLVEVKLEGGEMYSCKSVVLCAGPWAGEMLENLGLKLPLEPTRISVFYWKEKNPTGSFHVKNFPCIIHDEASANSSEYKILSQTSLN